MAAGPDVVGAHWTYCTPSDIDLLAERGVHMAHCPANSSRRGPHKVLIGRILDAGVNVAFGTDNMTEDMFQAMKIGSIIHRGGAAERTKAEASSPDRSTRCVPPPCTERGALGREGDLGTVTPGKLADLVVLDLDQAHLRPIINLVSSVVHYGHPGCVDSVMVGGRFLMRDGVVLCMDVRDTVHAGQEATAAAWRRCTRPRATSSCRRRCSAREAGAISRAKRP